MHAEFCNSHCTFLSQVDYQTGRCTIDHLTLNVSPYFLAFRPYNPLLDGEELCGLLFP
jgi:hypothetical protein